MTRQSVTSKFEPDTTSAGDSGFSRRTEIIWLGIPSIQQQMEFVCTVKPDSYIVYGVPLRPSWEVQP